MDLESGDMVEERPQAGVGADLRALRKARGVTLAALASATGRSVGWLSQVERGISSPTIDDLRSLADRLDAPLSLFFGNADAPAEERGHVVRWNAGRSLGAPDGGLTEMLLSPDLGGAFEIVRSVFDPGAELKEAQRRPTEEAGYLISGRLDLWIGETFFELNAGDAFRFRGEAYRWRNPGDEPAVAIWGDRAAGVLTMIETALSIDGWTYAAYLAATAVLLITPGAEHDVLHRLWAVRRAEGWDRGGGRGERGDVGACGAGCGWGRLVAGSVRDGL